VTTRFLRGFATHSTEIDPVLCGLLLSSSKPAFTFQHFSKSLV
jgi:hypothetical protein